MWRRTILAAHALVDHIPDEGAKLTFAVRKYKILL